MKKLVSLLAVFMLVCSMASAVSTIYVNKTLGGAASVAAAVAGASAGDTIIVNEAGTYTETAAINLEGVTLKGTSTPRPVIVSTAGTKWLTIHDSTIENLDLAPVVSWGGNILVWGTFSMKSLFIDCAGMDNGDTPAILIQPRATGVTTGMIEYVTLANKNEAGAGFIVFAANWDSGNNPNPAITEANCGAITFNHCTILMKDGWPLMFRNGWPTLGAEITVKNSIVGRLKVSATGDAGDCTIFTTDGDAQLACVHHHNLYPKLWGLFRAQGCGNQVVGHATSALSEVAGAPKWPDNPSDTSTNFLNPFDWTVAPVGVLTRANLALAPYSPLLASRLGDDGLNMGANVTPLPAAKNILVNKSGAPGTFSSVAAAVAAAAVGDTIIINEAGTYAETAQINLNGLTLKGATNPAPVIASTAGNKWLSIHNSSIENVDMTPVGGWHAMIMVSGSFSMKKVFVNGDGLDNGDSPIMWIQPKAGELTTGSVQYVTFVNKPGAGAGFIIFSDKFDGDAGTNFNLSSCGPIVFDHCVVLMDDGWPFMFRDGWPTLGGELTVKNSIVGRMKVTGNAGNVTVFTTSSDAQLVCVHQNNLYISLWGMYRAQGLNNQVVGFPAAGEVMGTKCWPDPADTSYNFINPFAFAPTAPGAFLTKADLMLKAGTSPALWKAGDMLNIGADISTVPVELSAFEIE